MLSKLDIQLNFLKMPKTMTARVKRELNIVPFEKKVETVRRVLNGESKVSVRHSTGFPESTLRGWLKRPEIIEEACKQINQFTSRPMTSAFLTPRRNFPMNLSNERDQKIDTGNKSAIDSKLHVISFEDKVEAVRRVLNGESKINVRKSTGVADSTLRRWSKSLEIVREASKQIDDIVSGTTSSVESWDTSHTISGCQKTDASSESGIDSGTTDLSDASSNQIDMDFPKNDKQSQRATITKNRSNSKRAVKRKRITSDSTDDDLPVAKRLSSGNMTCKSDDLQVNELESMDWRFLLCTLAAKDAVSRDLFVYMWEMLSA